MINREFESTSILTDSVTGGYMVVIRGTNTDGGRTSVVVANADTREEAEQVKDRLFAVVR